MGETRAGQSRRTSYQRLRTNLGYTHRRATTVSGLTPRQAEEERLKRQKARRVAMALASRRRRATATA